MELSTLFADDDIVLSAITTPAKKNIVRRNSSAPKNSPSSLKMLMLSATADDAQEERRNLQILRERYMNECKKVRSGRREARVAFKQQQARELSFRNRFDDKYKYGQV